MTQLDYFEVKTFEQAKVLTHELRMKILTIFRDERPRTAKQIADQLEMSASKVHYHVRELVKVGLLLLTETKVNSGIVEKYYLPIAKDIRIKLSKTEGEGIHLIQEQSQIISKTIRDFKKNLLRSFEMTKKDEKYKSFFTQVRIELTKEERDEFYDELKQLTEKWMNKQTECGNPLKEEYSVLLSLYKELE